MPKNEVSCITLILQLKFGNLSGVYEKAQKMLGANESPQIGQADKCLREVGIDITGKDTFHKNDVGIFFGEAEKTVPDPYFDGKGPDRTGCTFCGACMVGCPVGAKNTLDKNYLYLAEGLGVDILPDTLIFWPKELENCLLFKFDLLDRYLLPKL